MLQKCGDPIEFAYEVNIPRRDGSTQPGLGLMVRPFYIFYPATRRNDVTSQNYQLAGSHPIFF